MMDELEDPCEEADHVMPWRLVVATVLFSLVALVALTPAIGVLRLFSVPSPPVGARP
jgi:uncharacterized membrane protein YhhN